MRREMLVGWLGLLLAAVVPAAHSAAQSPWNLSSLTAALAQETAVTLRFSEERHLQFLTEPLVLEGTLSFDPPGRLEKQVLRPSRETMTIDGGLVTIEANPGDPRVRVFLSDYPALGAFASALRSILSGDLPALERIFSVALEGDENSWSLALTPRLPEVREAVHAIRLVGSASEIISLEILETGGDRSIVAIRDKI